MHRRQYLPGSHVKISRAEQIEINRNLRDQIARRDEAEARRHSAERDAARLQQTTGLRGFINKTKKFMTRPISLKPRRVA